jgi:hypothetical protein
MWSVPLRADLGIGAAAAAILLSTISAAIIINRDLDRHRPHAGVLRPPEPDLAAAVDRHIMSTVNGSRDLGSGDQAMRRSWMSRTASGGISGVKGTNSGAGG